MAAALIRKKSFLCSLMLHSTVRTIYGTTELQFDLKKSKTMKKILKKAERKKDIKWFAPIYGQKPDVDFPRSGKPAKSKERFSEGKQRRANHIGDVMYDTVCAIIGSGQLGVRANILQVQVIPDMSYMNIFWEASGDKEKDDQIELELNEKASLLRQILMETNQVGSVPKPIFVKDMSISKQKHIENLLYQIRLDMEKETAVEEVSETNSDVETVYVCDAGSDSNVKVVSAINTENGLDSNDASICEEIETEFRQDLYDVPHDVLMNKVVTAKLSAHQRPTIESTTNIDNDRFIDFDKKLKKVLAPKEKTSRKKMLRQLEQEELRNYEKEIYQSDEFDEEYEYDDDDDDVKEEQSGVDIWMQGYHKDFPDST